MKKSYLMIAAAATLFAACASNDTFKEINTQEAPIAFEQALNKTTRAAIGGGTGDAFTAAKKRLAEEGGFIVYGYKTPTAQTLDWTSYQTIFNNVNVYCTDEDFTDGNNNTNDYGSTWGYANLRFWDKTASYKFYAIAPKDPDHGTYGLVANSAPDALKFTIIGAQSAKSGDSDDFLIDRNGAEANGNYTTTHEKVGFEFHHIMAKVNFKVKSTLSAGQITITRLVMTGWDNGAGNFTQDLTSTPNQLNCEEWDIPTEDPGSATLVGADNTNAGDQSIVITCGVTPNTDANNYGDYVKTVTDWYIMVPQVIDASDLKFTLDYTYTDNSTNPAYTETFTDQEATLTTEQKWGTDSHTTYTLDIKPAAIEFEVTSICGFDVSSTPADIVVK